MDFDALNPPPLPSREGGEGLTEEAIAKAIRPHLDYRPHPWDIARAGHISGVRGSAAAGPRVVAQVAGEGSREANHD